MTKGRSPGCRILNTHGRNATRKPRISTAAICSLGLAPEPLLEVFIGRLLIWGIPIAFAPTVFTAPEA